MRLRWDWGGMALTSITAYEKVKSYSRGDIDGGFGAVFAQPMGPGFIPFPSESADGMPKHKQITQEFRLESGSRRGFSWLMGLYFFKEDITVESFSYDTLAGGAVNGYARQTQDNEATAVYGSVNMALGSNLGYARACATRGTRRTSPRNAPSPRLAGVPPGCSPPTPAIPISRATRACSTRRAPTPTSTRGWRAASAPPASRADPLRRHDLGGEFRDGHLLRGRREERLLE
jgi:hypothetical protein